LLIKVPTLDVQRANVQRIDLGQVAIGPITVDSLVLNNANFSLTSANATLHNVDVTISIHVSIRWHVHIGLPDWIPDIDEGDTYDLGSLTFGPLNVGDIAIPGLNNVNIHIPSLTASSTTVSADPLGLRLENASAEQVRATNTALPAAGFTIAGLSLDAVEGTDIAVPGANVDHATVAHFSGDALAIPAFTLRNLTLPAAHMPSASSSAPLDIPATLGRRGIGFGDDDSLLSVIVFLTPTALSHVEHLEITDANANATVGQIVLHNVTLPYDALNLTLSQLGLTSVAIPAFDAS
jgi:hypothetical protein